MTALLRHLARIRTAWSGPPSRRNHLSSATSGAFGRPGAPEGRRWR